MELHINYDYKKELLDVLPIEPLTLYVLKQAQGLPANTQVSLSFVTNEKIAALNERYRSKQGPTDVLSFECDGIEDLAFLADDNFTLGDIIIGVDVALTQTVEYGTSFEEEISLLIVHGLLHLCGYDHIEEEEAEAMEALELKLLDSWPQRSACPFEVLFDQA